jgi:hypothetical protein
VLRTTEIPDVARPYLHNLSQTLGETSTLADATDSALVMPRNELNDAGADPVTPTDIRAYGVIIYTRDWAAFSADFVERLETAASLNNSDQPA